MYKMDKTEKNLLMNFLQVRNQGLLFNKTNVDKNGKSTMMDPDLHRPIIIGDGIIPQIERFASKFAYSKFTVSVFNTMMNTLNEKAPDSTGNKYMLLCNDKLYNDIQTNLATYLGNFKTSGTYMYSKQANGYVDVGATFSSYEIGGNTISFKVDRCLSLEYGSDKGYGISIDLTADKTSGQPAIELFTLKGGDFISNKYVGVGGLDGLSSGIVSSATAASKLINWGLTTMAA